MQTSASSGEEEYVHMHNAKHQEFESLRSSLPERYYARREPPPSSQHRRQPSFQPHVEEEVEGGGAAEAVGGDNDEERSPSPAMEEGRG